MQAERNANNVIRKVCLRACRCGARLGGSLFIKRSFALWTFACTTDADTSRDADDWTASQVGQGPLPTLGAMAWPIRGPIVSHSKQLGVAACKAPGVLDVLDQV